MAKQPDAFRDFGILPERLPVPPKTVRAFLSPGRIIGQYIATGIVVSLGLGLALLLVLLLPFPLDVLGCLAALVGFGILVHLATHNDYHWIELDGTILRARHLYTKREIERPLEEIDGLVTMVYQIRTTETDVIESLLGRIKGVEVRFRDGLTPLRIMRADPAMTNARELIEAILFRMGQVRKLDTEVIEFAGKPLVRSIHWKGEAPPAPVRKTLKVCLACLLLLALLFGVILGFLGRQEQRLHLLGAVPPQEIALQNLIDNGPGSNPHVLVTDFRFGGHAVETNKGSWTGVWIALFPTSEADQHPGKPSASQEIKAVLSSSTTRNEAALHQLLRQRRLKGICSDTPGLSGGTLRTDLMNANAGAQLASAWVIEEMNEPPSAATVQTTFLGATVCYGLVLFFALVLFMKAS